MEHFSTSTRWDGCHWLEMGIAVGTGDKFLSAHDCCLPASLHHVYNSLNSALMFKHKHRVTYLVINSNEWMVWWESTGRSLPVHQQCPFLSIHYVLFHFGNIVRNIIDHVQVQVIRSCIEDLGKSLRRETLVKSSQRQLPEQILLFLGGVH